MKGVCLAATLAVISLVGCGDNSEEPGQPAKPAVFGQVESRINNDYYSTTFYPLKEISCEGDGVGAPFTCDATNRDGVDLEITGKVKSAKTYTRKVGGKTVSEYFVDFESDVTAASISSEAIERGALEVANKKDGTLESIDCPDEDIDVIDIAKVACVATDEDGSERTAEVTARDDVGVVGVGLRD